MNKCFISTTENITIYKLTNSPKDWTKFAAISGLTVYILSYDYLTFNMKIDKHYTF